MKRKWLEVAAFVIVLVIVLGGINPKGNANGRQEKQATTPPKRDAIEQIAANALGWLEGRSVADTLPATQAAVDSSSSIPTVSADVGMDSSSDYRQCGTW